MTLPQRKHIRLSQYDYSTPGGYFITICTRNRAALFGSLAGGEVLLSEQGQMATACFEELGQHIPGLSVDNFCVMPDHVHAILVIEPVGPPYMAADRSKQILSRAVQQYKAAVTRKCHLPGLWQPGYYDHIIRNDADLLETRQYITNNPATLYFERRQTL